jgi:ribosomal protein S18 acetylase RimI-like enzyme
MDDGEKLNKVYFYKQLNPKAYKQEDFPNIHRLDLNKKISPNPRYFKGRGTYFVDMDKLTDMVTDCLEYEDKITPEGKLMEKILDRLSSIREFVEYSMDNKCFNIITDNNENVVGYLGLIRDCKDSDDIVISPIYIKPEYRGRGYASIALSYVNWAIPNYFGCVDKVYLSTDKRNIPAVNLYKKHGFIQIDENGIPVTEESKENYHSVESSKSYIKRRYTVNNKKKVTGRRRFKCEDCGERFGTYDQLFNHATKYHKDLINDMDPHQYLYLKRNPGPKVCQICGDPTDWDPKKRKFNRLCIKPSCKQESRKRFQKNMKKVYGTDNLLTDPEHQANMLANRSISGTFEFPDGGQIGYVGQYELDFLEMIVKDLNFTSVDIVETPPTHYIKYRDTVAKRYRWYIPDYYIEKYNLVIEIKDSSKFPIDSKQKMLMKEKAIIKLNKFNYIKIVEKDYTDFKELLLTLEEKEISETDEEEYIYIIPETISFRDLGL